MATINEIGNITARCPGCNGGTSTFEYIHEGKVLGSIVLERSDDYLERFGKAIYQYRLYRCAGCGMGGIGNIRMSDHGEGYPSDIIRLVGFFPEAKQRLKLPQGTPRGIIQEFREAEICMENECFRAAAALFRSVLEKTMKDNGYINQGLNNLKNKINAATSDGIITEARKRRAHDEIRVLGNDILHDDWHEIKIEDVEPAHQYSQRILEDFYDDRESVLKLLLEAKRIKEEKDNLEDIK